MTAEDVGKQPGSPGEPAPPRNPYFRERILSSFGRQGLMRHLGARVDVVEAGSCEVVLDFREEVAQQHGYFHGGVVGALADNAGAYAAFTLIGPEESMLTVEYKVNLLAPALGQRLRAAGTVVRAGRTLTVSEVRVAVERDGAAKLCALATVTLMTLRTRGDGDGAA